ncbi:serine/threonine-protein kinase PLK4-like [Oppia nitens]|uniref:serine/threonine-protein kinase PLK4-like n=1 Tax=Oppia nitens TaxID=1686743 RepID=UPI0023DBFC92|nr:serine/threonine-protein kinase PLK4-like [Oppia nitens]
MDDQMPAAPVLSSKMFIQAGRLENEFQLGNVLGRGSFGLVNEAKNLIDEKMYAIKRINIEEYDMEMPLPAPGGHSRETASPSMSRHVTLEQDYENKRSEVKIWAQLDSDHFVQYRSSWVESYGNGSGGQASHLMFHIQMDLCWFTLKAAIDQYKQFVDSSNNQLLPPLGYYMATELLEEVLLGINYLHSRQPPIIHRDIKPKNILIKESAYGRFVKIADFGLAVAHREHSQSHTQNVGADKYMAPEVKRSRHYGPKADMYSIGVTMQELYNFDVNTFKKNTYTYKDDFMMIFKMVSDLLNGSSSVRPSCQQLLDKSTDWLVPFDTVTGYVESSMDINKQYDYSTDGKCEIKIITDGTCTINNQLVQPKIIVKHSTKLKDYYPVYKLNERTNNNRMRNMQPFSIGEDRANQLVDQFIKQFKRQFMGQIDPLVVKSFGTFMLKDMGTIRIYDLSIKGVSNMHREGPIELHTNSQLKLWSIGVNLTIDNLTADFLVDGQIQRGLHITGWQLQVLIKRCQLMAILEYNQLTKMLTLVNLDMTSFQGFELNTENLAWPFSQVVPQLVDHQMNHLNRLISFNAHRYLKETLKSFNVSEIVDNMDTISNGQTFFIENFRSISDRFCTKKLNDNMKTIFKEKTNIRHGFSKRFVCLISACMSTICD